MRALAIINQKGGCGKTTTAINLAGVLAKQGLRTLLVDLDPQSHCAAGLAIPEQRIDLDVGDAMMIPDEATLDPKRLLWRACRNLDLAPSRMKLAGLEAARGGLASLPDKDRRLAKLLARLDSPAYDIAIIDCPPSIGLLTFNALTAATEVLIPVETGFFSLQGAAKQVNTIRTLAKRFDAHAPYWLVATLHEPESPLAEDLLGDMRRRFEKRVAPVVIRRDPRLKESASYGQPAIEYAPDSMGAADYTALAAWVRSSMRLDAQATAVRAPELDAPAVVIAAQPPPEPGDLEGHEPAAMGVVAEPGKDPACPPAELEPALRRSAAAVLDGPAPTQAIAAVGQALSRAQELAARARELLLKRPVSIEALEQRVDALAGRAETRALASELRSDWTALATSVREGPPAPRVSPAALGARVRGDVVRFTQPLEIGARVQVAGDFSGWTPWDLVRLGGAFVLEQRLAPGRHQYRLIVDGCWMPDPHNPIREPNPFGDHNSAVDVPRA